MLDVLPHGAKIWLALIAGEIVTTVSLTGMALNGIYGDVSMAIGMTTGVAVSAFLIAKNEMTDRRKTHLKTPRQLAIQNTPPKLHL